MITSSRELRARVRAFLASEQADDAWAPRCDSWLVGFDPAFSSRLGAHGLIGPMLPTEFGGAGLGVAERLVVSEELLASGAPLAAHWFAERQFAPSLLRHGSAEQQQEWLPRITRGQAFIAIGLSEADAGSDLAAVRTQAVRTDGGWLITGAKLWSSGAHHAHAIVVLARGEGQRHVGLTQFIVRLPHSNVAIRPIPLISGAHHFNEVVLNEAFVPHADVLGTVGEGWTQAMQELAFERAGPERYLSTLPLLQELTVGLGPSSPSASDIGQVIADITALRSMNMRVVEHLATGNTAAIDIAMLKDAGTQFEQGTVSTALALAAELDRAEAPSTRALALLREAQFQAPGFTIRGGTSEVLRGIISRGLLR